VKARLFPNAISEDLAQQERDQEILFAGAFQSRESTIEQLTQNFGWQGPSWPRRGESSLLAIVLDVDASWHETRC
jgi:hypothetical protein